MKPFNYRNILQSCFSLIVECGITDTYIAASSLDEYATDSKLTWTPIERIAIHALADYAPYLQATVDATKAWEEYGDNDAAQSARKLSDAAAINVLANYTNLETVFDYATALLNRGASFEEGAEDFPLDSVVGRDCVRCIDAAAQLIHCVKAAGNSETEDTIADAAVTACLIYMHG